MLQNHTLSNIKKIAVLRAIALGDFIISLPALEALRKAYPEAEISLLCRPWNIAFARNRMFPFDRAIEVPPSRGVYDGPGIHENKKTLETFFEKMKQEEFDMAIQLHGGGRNSNPFVKKLGAKMTVGMCTPDALKLDKWIPYIYYQHEVHRYLEVVSLVGAHPVTVDPHIDILKTDLDGLQEALPQLKKPYVIIHPGASDKRRHWESKNYARLGDELIQRGYQVIITGVMSEKDIIEDMIKHMKKKPVIACDLLSLHGLTGLLSEADLFIGNDTGPLHLARAVGTPTVGIYWFANLVNWAPITRTWHRTAASFIMNCPVCGFDYTKDEFTLNYQNGDCGHMKSLVANVPFDEVLYKSTELLKMKKTYGIIKDSSH